MLEGAGGGVLLARIVAGACAGTRLIRRPLDTRPCHACTRTGLPSHQAGERERTGGIVNRPAGRVFAGRIGPAVHYRSYSNDSVKTVSIESDQVRLTNAKSVPPAQPATDGNATP